MWTANEKLRDIHPTDLMNNKKCRVIEFDNRFDLLEFLKKNKPKSSSVGHTETFYNDLKSYTPDVEKVEKIKNDVLNNLIKRGIITGTVYEGFKYHTDGEIIDYAALASGNPNCMMTPVKKYDKWFYELYINMSIPGKISEETITDGAIRLLETIKALEELNIEIKINIIDYSKRVYNNEKMEDLLVIIPLISHLQVKTYENLMPFITGSFLRGPLFTVARNSIKEKKNVDSGMGGACALDNAVNLWTLKEDSEIELANRIITELGITL